MCGGGGGGEHAGKGAASDVEPAARPPRQVLGCRLLRTRDNPEYKYTLAFLSEGVPGGLGAGARLRGTPAPRPAGGAQAWRGAGLAGHGLASAGRALRPPHPPPSPPPPPPPPLPARRLRRRGQELRV